MNSWFNKKESDILQSNLIDKTMFENLALRGLLSLLGAFLISLAVGVNYLWGIITIYGTSYFRIAGKDPQLTQDQTDIVFPLMLLGQAISIPFVTRYAKKVSSGMTCFVSGIAMSFIMYFASYTQSFSTFAALFGLGNGIIIGIIYILPIGHCYQFFPKNKTMISIFIISASGIGTLLFSYIALNTINFDNISLEAGGVNLFYGKEVAERFPQYLKILSGVTLACVSGGGLLLFEYPTHLQNVLKKQLLHSEKKQMKLASLMDLQFVLQMEQSKQTNSNPFGNMNYQLAEMNKNYEKGVGKVYGQRGDYLYWPALEESENEYQPPKNNQRSNQTKSEHYAKDQLHAQTVNQCPRTSDGPKEFIFWILFTVIVLGSNFGLMMSVNYRTFVKSTLMDDKYLILIGSIGAISCSMSRFLWGSLLEKQTFKAIYYCLCILNAVLAFTIPYISQIKEVYFAYIALTYICYGGHLGIFPAITSLIFGVRYGPQIYGILFYAFPVSNFIQYLLVNYIDSGYLTIFKISGIMSICALLMVKKVELSYDWSDRIREHNQRKRLVAR